MIDMGSIAAAVSSLKGASDIAKGLLSLHTMTEVQSKAIELNQAIIDAQHQIFAANAAQSQLVERVRQLEGQIAAMENWDAESQRYKMATPYSGVTVYAVQKTMSNGEPPHYLCANCFQSRKRSILANSTAKDGHIAIVCAACKFVAQTRWRGVGPAKYAEDITAPE
jgi:hypothetical protein